MRTATVACALVLVLAGGGVGAADEDVAFPLGPIVRAGRPLVVRVAGAERVRAAGTPWALPQGARGDEFLLQGARPEGGELTLEVRAPGAEREITVAVRELGADPVTAVLDGSELGDGEVRVEQTRLPTLREAWLAFDAVRGSFGGASGAVSGALAAWRADRAGRSDGAGLEPFLLPPSMDAYRAASEASRDAPALPTDVAYVLLLLAATETVLVLLLRRGRSAAVHGAWRRAAWLAGPPLAASLWLLAGPGPPRALRATVVVLSAPRERLALLLVEGRRAGAARFELPAGAGPAALVRFASDGGGESGVATGAAIEVRLDAGQSRLFAYRLPPVAGPGEPKPADADARPRREMERWLRALGWRGSPLLPAGRAGAAFEGALPGGDGARAIPAGAFTVERAPAK